jgi:hypothetical protein
MVFPHYATKPEPLSVSSENMKQARAVYDTTHNEIGDLYSLVYIFRLVKYRRLQWIRNVARMDGEGVYAELWRGEFMKNLAC